jgi:hypothetical protein
MKQLLVLPLLVLCMGASDAGCNESDSHESSDVEKQQLVYVKTQPPPWFDWSFERHLMIELYKARNQAVHTYSYVVSQYTGKILASCPSLGFPIPATTQLTNPNKWVAQGATLPQAEPNGMYSPPMTHATWVMCLGPDGKVEPAYWESDVMTFSRPMKEVNGTLVPDAGNASISIDPTRPNK